MNERICIGEGEPQTGVAAEKVVETTIADETIDSAAKSGAGPGRDILELMDASSETIHNRSGNRPFAQVLASRRAILAGGLGLVATSFIEPPAASAASFLHGWGWGRPRKPLLSFAPVPVAQGTGPVPSISADYQYQVLIPWGDPLEPGGPRYDGDPINRPSAADQERMIGLGHDGMWFFPYDYDCDRHGSFHRYGDKYKMSHDHGLLAINHEFGTNPHVLGHAAPANLDEVRRSQAAHGAAVVEIKKKHGKWQQVKSKFARRIHVNTPVKFTGPAAGHALLQNPAGNAAAGTMGNCANGYTPWGTYLTCEENFDGFFAATGSFTLKPEDSRYGFSATGFNYGWANFDPRFDLSNSSYVNEKNRFGWVVEIDPTKPNQPPIKRTALGRFKHEGVGAVEGKGGKVVCYMGDDQAFDYIYKFVSADSWEKMRKRGKSPLDEGKLYVARFNDDGTGNWLELTIKNPVLAARFSSQGELLIYARVAADLLGATPMDRPEWTTIGPNGDVYCTLTNNTGRRPDDGIADVPPGTDPDQRLEVNKANPQGPNPYGHIIKWRDSDEHVGIRFKWEIFVVARTTHGTEDTFGSPDGLWADPDGRLFIETDSGVGGQNPTATGGTGTLNNQLLVADTRTGEIRRLFAGVTGDEITGIAVTPDRRTMFVNIQHPGGDLGDPAVTNFPAPQGSGKIPRDCTIVITRKDGGIIGS